MRISRIVHEIDPATDVPRQTVTIELGPEDDEFGLLNGLIVKGRLEALLRILGRPGRFGDPADETEAEQLLIGFAWMANRTSHSFEDLLWACRDSLGWTWERLAALTELHPSAVRRKVASARQAGAEAGYWRDRTGFHNGPRSDANAHLAAQHELDGAAE